MVLAFRTLNDWRLWRALALVLAFGLFAIGCGGSGSSSGGSGAPPPVDDPEGNTPGTAVVIVPDGANFEGAINFGGDVDWFTFRAGQGILYTLQVFGFPPDPFQLPENDLTGPGLRVIRAQIVSFNGVTQIENSTGTDGGTEYNINVASIDPGADITLGDSRIVWVAPTTNDFFIRIRHEREITGIGHYVLHLSSSQLGTTRTGRLQFGVRDFAFPNQITNDMGETLYEGLGFGFIGFPFWEYPELDLVIRRDIPVG